MKNAAGDWRCDEYIPGELVYAGIVPIYHIEQVPGEVPSHFTGELLGWKFERYWYYWVGRGPVLPLKYASPLHKIFGKMVRVAGHCGCPSPEEWCGEQGVDCYHIDTQKGLSALAATLKVYFYDKERDQQNVKTETIN